MAIQFMRFTDHLYVHCDAINVGILRDGNKALLVDFGDGSIHKTLGKNEIDKIETVLFTHHHRDQASGIMDISDEGTKIGVPIDEQPLFDDVEKYWNDPQNRWHLYNVHPHSLTLAESIEVTDIYQEGDVIEWGNARISVLGTPGHTDGSVSYIVDVDGEKFAFCGDLIYNIGQIWELYSLQKGNDVVSDYHGFLGSREQLISSLLKLRDLDPYMLIPSHGLPMNFPEESIDMLLERLDICYDKYVAISALRHYFPQMFTEFEGKDGHMPIREGKPAPEFLRHYGTSWLIISETKEAFVMDCGNPNVVEQVQKLTDSGEIAAVSGLWITHYHDDHVDAVPQFQEQFGCPIYADNSVAEVVQNPKGFRMPCISPIQINVDNCTSDGESWTWNEFKMTGYHFPGQTYYHGGLLVEGHDTKMFFAGDSFTMSGIDDYCSGNRNWLGKDVGFDRCLKLMQELKPTHIFNCHVDVAFDFTDEEIRFMRQNLAMRERIYGKLFPWDSPNYGMDEYWIRCDPYEQDVKPGEKVKLNVIITNHSESECGAICQPILPKSWNVEAKSKRPKIPGKSEKKIEMSFQVPEDAQKKRTVIPVDITYNSCPLGQFREAILNII